jgi:hypothetical protein
MHASARRWWLLGGVAGLGGGLSLLAPSSPTYDPWSWLLWGQEIVDGRLDTRHGPSWKPLPVLVTTLLAPLGHIAPQVWLGVVRAAAIAAVVVGAALARRLTGSGGAGVVAGAVAAVGLALSTGFFRAAALGTSEPILILLVLLAADRHLAGARRAALACLWLAGLVRPELWPLLGLYGLWCAREREVGWGLLAAAGVLLLALWLGPEWWGAGSPWHGIVRAAAPDQTSYAGEAAPLTAAWHDLRTSLLIPVWVGAALLVVLGARPRPRPRPRRAPPAAPWLVAIGVAWAAVVLGSIAAGSAGNQRYFMGAVALLAVAGGVGWGRAAATSSSTVAPHLAGPVARVVGVAALVLVAVASVGRWATLTHEADRVARQDALSDDLGRAIARAGGPRAVLACGRPAIGPLYIPMLAWRLRTAAGGVTNQVEPRGEVFVVARRGAGSGPERPWPAHVLVRTAHWRVLGSSCPT